MTDIIWGTAATLVGVALASLSLTFLIAAIRRRD